MVASPRLVPSPSLESLASERTRASYAHDYASDDYESKSASNDSHGDGESNSLSEDDNDDDDDDSRDIDQDDYRPSRIPSRAASAAPSRHPSVPNFFGPPFYGRPPTPLPQTPSLTSLFRPSRPTTPDCSDEDHHHPQSHPHHRRYNPQSHRDGSPFRNRQQRQHSSPHSNLPDANQLHMVDDQGTVHRPSPRVPTYEYYGFVLYLFSSLCFAVYLLWAYLPSPFLHALGIYYYPNRWWALAVPAFLIVGVAYIFVALAAYNAEILAVRMASVETIVDGAGKIAVVDGRGRIRGMDDVERDRDREREREGGRGKAKISDNNRHNRHRKHRPTKTRARRDASAAVVMPDWTAVWSVGTDAVMDVPLAGVCEVLYGS